uniref:Putative ovule protein n=1 Tax=Solanum chacoense TaxID=4108 RepID=A0A0V0GNT1_SOLCH
MRRLMIIYFVIIFQPHHALMMQYFAIVIECPAICFFISLIQLKITIRTSNNVLMRWVDLDYLFLGQRTGTAS